MIKYVWIDRALPIGGLSTQLKSVIDYMCSVEQQELVWSALTETMEAKRFARYLLKDLDEKLDKLGKTQYLET